MKRIRCPLNGLRNIDEFVYGGEVRAMPDPAHCTDDEWADYIFKRRNLAGPVREWWQHVPSGYWLIVERNTVTDEIIRTCTVEEGLAAGGSDAR